MPCDFWAGSNGQAGVSDSGAHYSVGSFDVAIKAGTAVVSACQTPGTKPASPLDTSVSRRRGS